MRTRKRSYGNNEDDDDGLPSKKQLTLAPVQPQPNFERPVPAETWLTIFCFINSVHLGNPVAMTSRVFMELAHVRLHEKDNWLPGNNQRLLRPLKLGSTGIKNKNQIVHHYVPCIHNITTKKQVAFPECALPNNIVSFTTIEINYLDAKLLSFFSTIRHLLKHLNISLLWDQNNKHITALRLIVKNCGAEICSLNIDTLARLIEIDVEMPTILPQIRLIFISYIWVNELHFRVLMNWLSTKQSKNGQPKLLVIRFLRRFTCAWFVQQIRENFLRANTPSPFIVRIEKELCGGKLSLYERNNLSNARTGEQMTMQIRKDADVIKSVMIKRHRIGHPIERNQKWQELELLNWEAISQRQTIKFDCYRIGKLDDSDKQ